MGPLGWRGTICLYRRWADVGRHVEGGSTCHVEWTPESDLALLRKCWIGGGVGKVHWMSWWTQKG